MNIKQLALAISLLCMVSPLCTGKGGSIIKGLIEYSNKSRIEQNRNKKLFYKQLRYNQKKQTRKEWKKTELK